MPKPPNSIAGIGATCPHGKTSRPVTSQRLLKLETGLGAQNALDTELRQRLKITAKR